NPDEFTPNFVLGDVSDDTAELPPKRPNFRQISHSGTFPTKRPNFPLNGRISAQFRTRGRFRRNGRISAEFCTRDVSAEMDESIPPNFCQVLH
ncbi:MAG: hypothetical protein Q8881_04265, partial [Sweet potato little leaf phytoplasma]|nr:hypothetical protein [Sweet potato little leaf phytoplasma]